MTGLYFLSDCQSLYIDHHISLWKYIYFPFWYVLIPECIQLNLIIVTHYQHWNIPHLYIAKHTTFFTIITIHIFHIYNLISCCFIGSQREHITHTVLLFEWVALVVEGQSMIVLHMDQKKLVYVFFSQCPPKTKIIQFCFTVIIMYTEI